MKIRFVAQAILSAFNAKGAPFTLSLGQRPSENRTCKNVSAEGAIREGVLSRAFSA